MIKRYSSTKLARKARVRGKLFGTTERPRLSVFRSGKHIYAQLIDDESGLTLASASDVKADAKGTKTEHAAQVGKNIAAAAKQKKILKVTFDRGHYKFLGRVKALAQAAREQGLEF